MPIRRVFHRVRRGFILRVRVIFATMRTYNAYNEPARMVIWNSSTTSA